MNLGNCKISLLGTVNKGVIFWDWKERASVTSTPSGIPDIGNSADVDYPCASSTGTKMLGGGCFRGVKCGEKSQGKVLVQPQCGIGAQ